MPRTGSDSPQLLKKIDRVLRPAGHVFYGWWIVISGTGILWLSALLWMQSYGAYVVLLQADFGWSKTVLGFAFALTRIESGILGPVQGWLADRFGPRIIMSIGTVIFGIGFMLFANIDSLLGFYLTFALMAVGSSVGGFGTVVVSVVNWFTRHRAKALALSQMGMALGGLSVPLIIFCLESFGWRTTAFYSGVVVLLVGLPLVQVFRHRPEEKGERPDGIPLDPRADDNRAPGSVGRDYTAREAMRTWQFWLISVGHAAALLAVSSVMVHLVPHLSEGLGYSLSLAGAAFALMTGFLLVGQLTGGYLGDRFDKRVICTLCMIGHGAALLLIAFAASPLAVIAFSVLHGLSWGMRGPQMMALRADYFGPSSFGTIMGFSSLVVMLGMASGPVIAGYMADVSGSYQSGFTLLAVLCLLGSVCFLAATPPRELPFGGAQLKR